MFLALIVRAAQACPNDRPGIVCVQGAGIDGNPLPAVTVGNKWIAVKLAVTQDVRIRDLDILLNVDHGDNDNMIISRI
jgi:hypothetical protein